MRPEAGPPLGNIKGTNHSFPLCVHFALGLTLVLDESSRQLELI